MKNIFNNIKAYFLNINRYKAATVQESIFAVLDTETTGLDVNEGHRIVSIGATKIKLGRLKPCLADRRTINICY